MQSYLLFTILCALHICFAAQCNNPSGLTSWSSRYGATLTTDIVISTPVIVDIPLISAQGITIASGGALYFDQSQSSISLTVNNILISANGGLYIGTEACPYTQRVTITLANPQGANTNAQFGTNFIGVAAGGILELHGAKGLGRSWTKLARTAVAGSTSIQVTFTTTGWQQGDRVVIATTDYSPLQSEVVTITSINGNSISFTPPLMYDHFGLVTQNVDESAEVGLLTRNILIQGKSNNGAYYGGHLMIGAGFSQVHIEGVEFNNMGQDEIARYPIHFHMCGNVPAGTYVKYNSIHDTNFRCVTIHGTHGLLVEGNVAYKNLGHCYFLEDGVEQNNTLRGNLAVLTLPKDFGQKVGSDASNTGLSSFWISNPLNYFEGNVAVGSYTAGFWIITRLGARGLSACLPQYQNLPYRVSNLQLGSFKDNVAHSCDFGVGIESTFWDAGDVPAQTCDTPVANWEPHNADGSMAWTFFENMTVHHIRDRGFWARMPNVVVDGSRFADNYESLEFATSGDHPPYASQQVVQNSIIVGFSDNKGNKNEPTTTWQAWDNSLKASIPVMGVATPINGIKMYDGPQVIVNSVFSGFPTTPGRAVVDAPIGARLADQSQVATTNYFQNVQFIGVGTRYSVIDNVMDGGLTGNFRDKDGSVTGFVGATALRNLPFYSTPECQASNVYMLACPHKYAQLWVLDMTTSGVNNNMIITRTQLNAGAAPSAASLQFKGFASGPAWRYQPIVSIGSSYLLRFQDHLPSSLVLQLNNAELGESVNLAICYPRGAVIQSVQRGYASYTGGFYPSTQPQSFMSSLSPVTSISAVSPTGFYYDVARSIIYVNVQQRNARTDYGNFCPTQGCDLVWITAQFPLGGAARDCTQDAYASGGLFKTSSAWLAAELTSAPSIASVLSDLLSNTDFPLPITVPGLLPTSRPPTPSATTQPTPPPAPTDTTAPTTTPTPSATPSSASTTRAPTSAPTTAPTTPGACNCGVNLSCCGTACYSPLEYNCYNNALLCPRGLQGCGGACYSPSLYSCASGALQPLS